LVGLTILVLHTVGIPWTGPSVNPARSFGAAVVKGYPCWETHWIYWVGPLLGASIAAMVANLLFLSNPTRVKDFLISSRGKAFEDVVLPEQYHSGDAKTTEMQPTKT